MGGLSKGDRTQSGKDFANVVKEGHFPNVVRKQKKIIIMYKYIKEIEEAIANNVREIGGEKRETNLFIGGSSRFGVWINRM